MNVLAPVETLTGAAANGVVLAGMVGVGSMVKTPGAAAEAASLVPGVVRELAVVGAHLALERSLDAGDMLANYMRNGHERTIGGGGISETEGLQV